MSRLGEQFGMTGNGLAKICKRFDVPYPGRGHWMKKEAGKKVVTTPLLRAKPGAATVVTIAQREPGKSSRRSPAVQIALDEARTTVGSLVVSEVLIRPHAIIAGWLATHARETKEAKRERDPWRRDLHLPSPFTEQDHRRHRLLDALFKELERQGARVRTGKGNLLIATVSGQDIEFEFREKMKQGRRPLNDFEKMIPAIYGSSRFTLEPTGFFLLSIKTYFDGTLRREWLEKPGASIEEMLPKIVATLLAAGPAVVERQRRFAELAEAQQAARERSQAEARQREEEAASWRRLVDAAHAWKDFEVVREFVAILRNHASITDDMIEGRTVAQWIEWAEVRLRIADPLGSGVAAALRRIVPRTLRPDLDP